MGRFLLSISFIFLSFFAIGQDDIPKLTQLVTDEAGLFSQSELAQLNQRLIEISNKTSNQIAVYTTKDIKGFDVADYGVRIAQKSQIGQEGLNNGILILVKPKLGRNDRGRVTIQVGYGLEPVVTDLASKRVIDNEMIPRFKQNDYLGGINNAITVLDKLARQEFNSDEYAAKEGPGGAVAFPIILFIIIFILLTAMNAKNHSKANKMDFWASLLYVMLQSRSNHHGSYRDFNSGSGGFGGGGGGFGGFGGGGFGGGGASGGW